MGKNLFGAGGGLEAKADVFAVAREWSQSFANKGEYVGLVLWCPSPQSEY
jgi:hypothetical protein